MTALGEKPAKTDPANIRVEGLIRRLARRYFFVLSCVAALVVIDQAIIQPCLVRLNSYAPAMNMAGRQRMLSQKLSKSALALLMANDDQERLFRRDELRSTLAHWSAAQAALQHSDHALGVDKLGTPNIHRAWAELQPHFQAMQAAASKIVEMSAPDAKCPSHHHANEAMTLPDLDREQNARAVAAILEHESDYLLAMEHVVMLLEEAAERQISWLRMVALGIGSGVIVLLIALGWFVVRPATRTIRNQVDELELRVADRTRELADANRALRHEMVERELAETKTQLLSTQLAHSARVSALGHLTAGLAHEINQPLAAIANYAETCDLLLAADRPNHDGRLRKSLDQIKQAALRTGQIVRRMRNFVRPNSGPPVEVELNLLVREVAELCRFEAERAGVRVTLELRATDVRIHVDPIQIQQVLVNLVQNAISAMHDCPRDDRRLVIRTCAFDAQSSAGPEHGDQVQIDVIDSGPGIPSDSESELFKPFHTTKADGLGIGLAICRSIVERHGGTIWAAAPEYGAMFSFSLPCNQTTNDASRREQADCVCR
jgi:two-component system, LuxR family, sensor kinase FixL